MLTRLEARRSSHREQEFGYQASKQNHRTIHREQPCAVCTAMAQLFVAASRIVVALPHRAMAHTTASVLGWAGPTVRTATSCGISQCAAIAAAAAAKSLSTAARARHARRMSMRTRRPHCSRLTRDRSVVQRHVPRVAAAVWQNEHRHGPAIPVDGFGIHTRPSCGFSRCRGNWARPPGACTTGACTTGACTTGACTTGACSMIPKGRACCGVR